LKLVSMMPARPPPIAAAYESATSRPPRGVLVQRDQHRRAAALRVGGADGVSRRLRRDHPHVEVGARLDLGEVDVEAVGERERAALLDVRLDVLPVDHRVVLVGEQDHHDVGALHRLADLLHREARVLRLVPRRPTLAQRDRDRDARVLEVEGVRVALGAVADDRHLLVLDQRKIGVLVVVDLHGVLLRVRK
jgi:hypothetical protein